VASVKAHNYRHDGAKTMSKREPFTPEELAEASHYEIVIQWSEEDQIFIASVPELTGVVTHGNTPAEAAENAVEVAALWIYASRKQGDPIPEPRVVEFAR
jgi:predicted RNase H-like HicB family nuclease